MRSSRPRSEITLGHPDSALGSLLSEPLPLQEVVNLLQAAFPDAPQEEIKKGLSIQLTAHYFYEG